VKDDPEARARLAAHQQGCVECQRFVETITRFRDAALAAGEAPLDDLARARIASGLSQAFAAQEARQVRRSARGAWALGAIAVTVAALFVVYLRLREGVLPPPETVLKPYVAAGAALSGTAVALVGQPIGQLDLPAGTLVRATLRDRARLTVLGPAHLKVRPAAKGRVVLELSAGRLVGDYDHKAGGVLEIDTPQAVAEVVGTRFVLEVAERTRVGVASGVVKVRASGTETDVDEGKEWSPKGLVPLSEELAEVMAEHARAGLPPSEPSGLALVDGVPAGAEVRSASGVLGTAPLAAALSAGSQRLTVSAAKFASSTVEVSAQTGQLSAMRYQLSPVTVPPTEASSPPTTPARRAETPRTRSAEERSPKEPDATTTAERAPANDVVPAPAPSAESIYTLAEQAMRAGDHPLARTRLQEVVRRFPDDPLADAALYELARISPPSQARAWLDQLLGRDRTPSLREPARFLRCRLDVDDRVSGADRCLTRFRREFPDSPHDAEALALLAGMSEAKGDCRAALPLLEEYLRRYPNGPFAAQARGRIARCRP
jgi:TolA-binding protein